MEKVYETLATKNELLSSENAKDYFKIIMDNRSLNYENFFEKGNSKLLKMIIPHTIPVDLIIMS